MDFNINILFYYKLKYTYKVGGNLGVWHITSLLYIQNTLTAVQ